MPKVNFREEVLNVALAELLEQRGMLSVPETIRKSIAKKTRDLPDILVGDLLGLRIVIEGRFNKGKQARDSLLKDAQQRVEDGISPVCLAVLYPEDLRSSQFTRQDFASRPLLWSKSIPVLEYGVLRRLSTCSGKAHQEFQPDRHAFGWRRSHPEEFRADARQVETWRQTQITDEQAKLIFYRAFVEEKLDAPKSLLADVHRVYFEPEHPEFAARTMWSLSNAFTSAFKKLDPIPQFKATAKLGEFLKDSHL